MSSYGFGVRGECPECGRDIGLVEGAHEPVLRYHRDVDGDGSACAGRGQPPKLRSDRDHVADESTLRVA